MPKIASAALLAVLLGGGPAVAAPPTPSGELVLAGDRTAYADVRFDRPVWLSELPVFSKNGSVTAVIVQDADGGVASFAAWSRVFDAAAAAAARNAVVPVPGPAVPPYTEFWSGGGFFEAGTYRFHLVTDAPAEIRMTFSSLDGPVVVRANRSSPARAYTHTFGDPLLEPVGVLPVTLAQRSEFVAGMVGVYKAGPGVSSLDLCVTPTDRRGCGANVAGRGVRPDKAYSWGFGSYGHVRSWCGDQLGLGARHLTSVVRTASSSDRGASLFLHLPVPYTVPDCALPYLSDVLQ